jgi:hypothetical protein
VPFHYSLHRIDTEGEEAKHFELLEKMRSITAPEQISAAP